MVKLISTLRFLVRTDLSKFTSADIPLFTGIIGDLFPGVKPLPSDYGVLMETMEDVSTEFGLQPCAPFLSKAVQLWETIIVRHGS